MKKAIVFIVIAQFIMISDCLMGQQPDGWVTAPAAVVTNRSAAMNNRIGRFGSMSEQQSYNQTIMSLRRAKLQLRHSKNDFGGHQQTAIDACDKAIQELETVVRASSTNPQFVPKFTPASKTSAAPNVESSTNKSSVTSTSP